MEPLQLHGCTPDPASRHNVRGLVQPARRQALPHMAAQSGERPLCVASDTAPLPALPKMRSVIRRLLPAVSIGKKTSVTV